MYEKNTRRPRVVQLLVVLVILLHAPGASAGIEVSAGASFVGDADGDHAGWSVDGAGDVNWDGFDDLLIGAPQNDENGLSAGQVFVVLGMAAGWVGQTDLSLADASFWGEGSGDEAGTVVAGVGDVSGDGIPDILIAAPGSDEADTAAGEVYLVLGDALGWSADTDLALADASFLGQAADEQAGSAMAGAGDLDGDGIGDLLIASRFSSEGGSQAVQVYLFFGDVAGWGAGTDLGTADASFWGETAGDEAGAAVAGAGDVNGDGFDDLLIGAATNDETGPDAGQVYVILGKASGWGTDVDLASADGSILGATSYDQAGFAVAGVGDADGDGYDDLLLGAAFNSDAGYDEAGQAYLIPGQAGAWSMDTQLATAAVGSFMGEEVSDLVGWSVDGAGDFDGDGLQDLLLGTPGSDTGSNDAGRVDVVLGKGSGWALQEPVSGSDAVFVGPGSDDLAGWSVSGAGDVDGDGYDDLVVGAPFDDSGGFDAGRAYLVFGLSSADLDGDGQTAFEGDCDDQEPTVFHRASELCDGLDNDCDGLVDEGCDGLQLVPTDSFLGEAAEDRLGFGATAGDLDGDGLSDLVLGAPYNDDAGDAAGRLYLFFGGGNWGMDTSAGEADASFVGETDGDLAGYALAGCGDVDGDGIDDLLVGAPESDEGATDAGQAYLVLGRTTGWNVDEGLDGADASFLGEGSGDDAGKAVAGAGDVDGDGYDDLLIGAWQNSENADSAGQTYLILGQASGWTMDTDLSTSDASFLGEAEDDHSGESVAGAGDVDGDGYDDLLISAQWATAWNSDDGIAYLVLGRASGWSQDTDLSAADASFHGEAANDHAGSFVAGAGDVDGDGLDDILVGASCNDENGTTAGQIYLILGRTTAFWPGTDLATSDASFLGEEPYDSALFVAGAGDVNADGLDDFLVAAQENGEGGENAGQAYLIMGRAAGWAMDTSLSDATASFVGEEAQDWAGVYSAAAGDADGDGHDDLLIVARYNDEAEDLAGQVYLVPGFPCVDADGDGIDVCSGDCDDGDSSIYPGAPEDPCDNLDSDCDGNTAETEDDDGDGYSECDGDCDDTVPTANLDDVDGDGATTCDDDCDDDDAALNLDDADGDGFDTCHGDCDDDDAALNLADADGDGDTTCDGDCDDSDPLLETLDLDNDGVTTCDGDCEDADATVYPLAAELCDGQDNDCDGSIPEYEDDLDGDGYWGCEECDDADPDIYPGAFETCDDGVDSDCGGDLEESEVDNDGDGFSECGGDCDDTRPHTYPGAPELCNFDVDDDCNPITDEWVDGDGDGHTICQDDCDDTDPTVFPDAPELCDGQDNDCNDQVDEGIDHDGDGYLGCDGDDCDDESAGVNPGAPEVPYNGVDEDCDGSDMSDQDGDGVDGWPVGDDCDDFDAEVFPGAVEDCTDGIDGDCDGQDDAFDGDCVEPGEEGGCSCSTPAGRGAPPALVLLLASVLISRRRRGCGSRRGAMGYGYTTTSGS